MTWKLPQCQAVMLINSGAGWWHVSLVVGLGLGLVGLVSQLWPWSWFQCRVGKAGQAGGSVEAEEWLLLIFPSAHCSLGFREAQSERPQT